MAQNIYENNTLFYSDDFLDFCDNFEYYDGTNKLIKNCKDIFYNMLLLQGGYRLSFMIQPIDYKYSNAYANIIMKLLESYDNIDTKCHYEGTLVYLKINKKIIENHYDVGTSTKKLGFILSYPCFNHERENFPKFVSFNVYDEKGVHQLFANWYNDDGTEFYEATENFGLFLMNIHPCETFIEFNNKKRIYH